MNESILRAVKPDQSNGYWEIQCADPAKLSQAATVWSQYKRSDHGVIVRDHEATERLARAMAAAPQLERATRKLSEILYGLLDAGRIDWTEEDAPYIHGWIEYAEAALAEVDDDETD
jgi:hypothetical protein